MTDTLNDIIMPSIDSDKSLSINEQEFLKDLVANEFYYRREMVDKLKHPNRNIDEDCGYPQTNALTAEQYLDLYQRFPIATRIVDLPVDESWRSQPDVFESQDETEITQFEQAWDDLNTSLRGEHSWFQDQEGSPIWEHLQRVDKLSRIGHYGILFLEFDDVGETKENGDIITWADPAPGFEEDADGQLLQPTKKKKANKDKENPFNKSKTKAKGKPKQETNTEETITSNAGKFSVLPKRTNEEDETAKGKFPKKTVGKTKPEFPSTDETVDAEDPTAEGEEEPKLDEEGNPIEEDAADEEGPSWTPKFNLIGIRCFDEVHASISVWEGDQYNSRYGYPKEYTIQFGEVEGISSGTSVNSVLRDVKVHWSRVIHVCDGLMSSECMGTPGCRPAINDILDLQKIFGASGEGYWRMAFPGLSFESHSQLGSKARFDVTGTKEQLERYQNTLQRYLATTGGSVKLLSGSVTDPTPHIETRINSICIYLKCPVRIFKGSERGELASSQDKDTWDERMAIRQVDHITPKIIAPFVDRLIRVGVLPEPKGFSVEWKDITQLSKSAKMAVALSAVQALTAYISGGCDTLIDPLAFLVRFMDFTTEEAKEMLEAAQEHTEEKQAEEAQKAEEQGAIQAAQMASGGLPPGIQLGMPVGQGKPPQGPPGAPGAPGAPAGIPAAIPDRGPMSVAAQQVAKKKKGAVPLQFVKNDCPAVDLIENVSPNDF